MKGSIIPEPIINQQRCLAAIAHFLPFQPLCCSLAGESWPSYWGQAAKHYPLVSSNMAIAGKPSKCMEVSFARKITDFYCPWLPAMFDDTRGYLLEMKLKTWTNLHQHDHLVKRHWFLVEHPLLELISFLDMFTYPKKWENIGSG